MSRWNDSLQRAVFEPHFLAATFEEFVSGLAAKPEIVPFNFPAFEAKLPNAIQATLETLLKNHPRERFFGFGLYTDDEGSILASAANTREHLEKNCKELLEAPHYYTYATTEWTYEGTDDAPELLEMHEMLQTHRAMLFTKAKQRAFRGKIVDLCAQALINAKNDGLFSTTLDAGYVLMVSLGGDEMPQATWKRIKKY